MVKKKTGKTALLYYVLPFVLIFAVFKLYPMIYGFFVSFLDRNSIKKLSSTSFVGLKNYINVLTSQTFWNSFVHTLIFSFVYTLSIMFFGTLMGIIFNRKFKGRTVVRTMFYMPYVTNMIAVGIVFKFLLNPTRGPVNAIFRVFGFSGPKWLSSPTMALPTAAVIASYVALAFNIITVLAALQEIPQDYFEVARLEGASFLQTIKHIILPILVPTLFMLLTINVINSFKSYTTIVGLTGGGPGKASRTISYQIYEDAFSFSKFSIASAEGTISMITVIIVNRILTAIRKKGESR